MKVAALPPPGRRSRRSSARGSRSSGRGPAQRFSAFIAYADIPAARHAIERVNRLVERSGRTVQPMLWRFDQLVEPRWHDMALREAAGADAIVITMRHTRALDARVDSWLSALAKRFHGATVSALVLIGDEEAWTISLQQADSKVITTTEPHALGLKPRMPRPREAKEAAAVAA